MILIEEMAEATGTGGSASTREVADQNRKATEDQDWVRQLKDWMTKSMRVGTNCSTLKCIPLQEWFVQGENRKQQGNLLW